MRVNVYAEEMSGRVEIISKEIDGQRFTGLRFYLELPVTMQDGRQVSGPFMHRPGDDDSSAVTFWGKRDLRIELRRALELLDKHYAARVPRSAAPYYRVEESANQPDCQCDNCVMWTVVFDDGEAIEIGMSWRGAEGKDAAQDVCDLMNMAFDTGFDLSYDDPHESPREIISESNDD